MTRHALGLSAFISRTHDVYMRCIYTSTNKLVAAVSVLLPISFNYSFIFDRLKLPSWGDRDSSGNGSQCRRNESVRIWGQCQVNDVSSTVTTDPPHARSPGTWLWFMQVYITVKVSGYARERPSPPSFFELALLLNRRKRRETYEHTHTHSRARMYSSFSIYFREGLCGIRENWLQNVLHTRCIIYKTVLTLRNIHTIESTYIYYIGVYCNIHTRQHTK